jgi:Flp pilus assembly pilin Flp
MRLARRDRRGVTALEYGIIAVFLVLGLIGIFQNYGTTLTNMYTTTEQRL